MGPGKSKETGKVNRRKGQGRRDESLNRRQNDRRVGDRRRVGRRRKVNCPTCGFPLSPKDVCSRCQVRVIRIRKRS